MTLMLFTACSNATPNEPIVTTNNNTTAAQTTAAPGSAPEPDIVATLKLGEIDISEYVIIYESPANKTKLGTYWREEYDAAPGDWPPGPRGWKTR